MLTSKQCRAIMLYYRMPCLGIGCHLMQELLMAENQHQINSILPTLELLIFWQNEAS